VAKAPKRNAPQKRMACDVEDAARRRRRLEHTLRTRERADLLIKEWWWIAAICLLYLVEIGVRKMRGGV
jgi:hypothetical protein